MIQSSGSKFCERARGYRISVQRGIHDGAVFVQFYNRWEECVNRILRSQCSAIKDEKKIERIYLIVRFVNVLTWR